MGQAGGLPKWLSGKVLPMQETWVQSLAREEPLEAGSWIRVFYLFGTRHQMKGFVFCFLFFFKVYIVPSNIASLSCKVLSTYCLGL